MNPANQFWDLMSEALRTINEIDSVLKLIALALVLLVAMTVILICIVRTDRKLVRFCLRCAFGIVALAILLGFTAKVFAIIWHVEAGSLKEDISKLEVGNKVTAPLEAKADDGDLDASVTHVKIPQELASNIDKLVDLSDFYHEIGARSVSTPTVFAGRLAFYQENPQEAKRLLEEAKRLEPAKKETLNDLGVISYTERRFNDAANYFQLALKIDKRYPNAMNGLGLLAYEEGKSTDLSGSQRKKKLEEAIEWYEKALDIDKEYGKAINNRGLAYRELSKLTSDPQVKESRLKMAREDFQRAAMLLQDSIEVRTNLGIVDAELGDIDEAIESYRGVLELEPNSAQALNNLAMILIATGTHSDPSEAVSLAERAARLRPKDPKYLDTLARAYFAAGRKEEALSKGMEALERARAIKSPEVTEIEGFVKQLESLVSQSTGRKAQATPPSRKP